MKWGARWALGHCLCCGACSARTRTLVAAPPPRPPAPLSLQSLLRGLGTVWAVEERSLTGTWDVSSLQRWRWKTKDGGSGAPGSGAGCPLFLVLAPRAA